MGLTSLEVLIVNGVSAGPEEGGAGEVWRARARGWKVAGLSLVLLCLSVYLPGLWTIPPVDRDECRFAQASRQMFEQGAWPAERLDRRTDEATGMPLGMHSGGWVVPMVQEKPRLNKPPLVYWLQVASAWVMTGGRPENDAMWMYRLPSVLCAIGTVLITWRIGLRMFDPRAAWLAAVLLAVSPMVVWDAHQARSDQLLTLCTTAAMGCLWMVLKRDASSASPSAGLSRWVIGLWLAVGMGVLAKGFITPLVVFCALGTVCVLQRSWRPVRAVRPLVGLVTVLLIATPWVWLLSRQVGIEVYAKEVWKETFLRAATGAKDGKSTFLPPGVHFLLSGVLFWPGCLFLWGAVARAVGRAWCVRPAGRDGKWGALRSLAASIRARAAGRHAELFLLAWFLPAWIVFELTPAKLPHYTMPMYPAVALLCGRAAVAAQSMLKVGGRVQVWGWFLICALLPLFIAYAVFIADLPGETRTGVVVFLVGIVGIPVWIALLISVQLIRAHRWVVASVIGACASAYALALILHFAVPLLVRAEKPKLLTGNNTQRIFDVVRSIDPQGLRPLASVYHEDSVVFQSRGRVQKIRAADQADWLGRNPAGVLIGTRDADAVRRDAVEVGGYAVLAPVRMDGGRYAEPPVDPRKPGPSHEVKP